jgi:hypothetical protein
VTDAAGGHRGKDRVAAPVALGERLVSFKRFYRWLNLTLVQQAFWPLLVLLTAARGDSPEGTPMPWYLARLGAPAVAAALAFVYLRQALPGQDRQADLKEVLAPEGRAFAGGGLVAAQARLLVLGLPVMLAVARLIATPSDATVKLLLFGAAQVVAFHVIHFGVVARSYSAPDQGRAAGVILFGLSWAMSTALLTGVGSGDGSMALAFAGGLLLGWVVGGACLAIREGLGGFWPAAALQWFVVYLIFGFTS